VESQISGPRHSRSNYSRGVGELGVSATDLAEVVVLKWMEDWVERADEEGITLATSSEAKVPAKQGWEGGGGRYRRSTPWGQERGSTTWHSQGRSFQVRFAPGGRQASEWCKVLWW